MRITASIIVSLLTFGAAEAHEQWANGAAIPKWIKEACCTAADAHHLRPEQVHRVSEDWYEVDGYYGKVAAADAQPSQDGEYWIFYKDNKSGTTQSGVYCFFVPMPF